jgi:hypothetical protein
VDRFGNLRNALTGQAERSAKRRRALVRLRPGTELLENRTSLSKVHLGPPSLVRFPARSEASVIFAHVAPSSHVSYQPVQAGASGNAKGSDPVQPAAAPVGEATSRSALVPFIHPGGLGKVEINGQYGVNLDMM